MTDILFGKSRDGFNALSRFGSKRKLLATVLTALTLTAVVNVDAIYAADDKNLPAQLDADIVEYDLKSGIVTATDNVLMKRGTSRVAGKKAAYNVNTKEGWVEGNVVAVRDDMRITCDRVTSDGQEHMIATGNVHAYVVKRNMVDKTLAYV